MTKQQEIAANLENNLAAMKSVHGRKWPSIMEDFSPLITDIMARECTTNPLKAILPVAKQMETDGKSPSVLLAVATQMSTQMPTQKPLRKRHTCIPISPSQPS